MTHCLLMDRTRLQSDSADPTASTEHSRRPGRNRPQRRRRGPDRLARLAEPAIACPGDALDPDSIPGRRAAAGAIA